MSSLLYDVCQLASNSSDNTIFRTLGNTIHNAFANAGWALDTSWFAQGANSWNNAVANGTAGSINATEIWHMTDTLQSQVPCYVWLNHFGTYTTSYHGIAVVLGSRWDGTAAGSGQQGMAGPLSPWAGQRAAIMAASTTTYPSYFCGSNNRIVMSLWSTQTQPVILSIERTHDAAGNDTTEGILLTFLGTIQNSSGASVVQYFWNPFTGYVANEASLGFSTPTIISATGTTACGSIVQHYPICHSRGVFLNPSLNLIGMSGLSSTAFSPASIPMYGTAHTYLPFPGPFPIRYSGGTSYYIVAMRYE